jgi:hypothetical protein
VADDIVTIEVRALAGVTSALVDKELHTGRRGDGGHPGPAEPPTGPPGSRAEGGARFVPYFPYLGIPHDGFDTPRA